MYLHPSWIASIWIFFIRCASDVSIAAVVDVDSTIQGVVGEDVKLPCDVTIDKVVTILRWMKNDKTIYVVDYRDGVKHHKKDDRMKFISQSTTTPFLIFNNITTADEGVYTCIVTSSRRGSINYYTELLVIVPPDSIRIYDKSGKEVEDSTIGPFDENSHAEMTCQVTGGHPQPTVKWFHGGDLLDETIDSNATSVLRNVLNYGPLKRIDLFTKLTCQASNSDQIGALGKSVKLDINYKPLTVKIVTKESPLVAGAEFKINCSSSGARPPAMITWWLDKEQLLTAQSSTTDSGNTTVSSLVYTPMDSDVGKKLECRSELPILKHKPLRDHWILHIHYKPKVNMSMDPPKADVKEGDKVVFNCHVSSNPVFTAITWFHKRRRISENQWRNMKIENTSLILSSVTREMSGVFTCLATNPVGIGETTQPIVLQVKYIPVCEKDRNIVGATLKETVDVNCRFNSFPPLKSVRWQFNTTQDRTIDIPENQFSVADRLSVLSYTVNTKKDFGTLLCWGKNELGEQAKPCLFKVIEASTPDKPTNCTNVNHTSSSVIVKCIGGHNGGLMQKFSAEVFDMSKKQVIKNVSLVEPIFILDGLPHSTDFLLTIYSSNSKGPSEKKLMQVYTSVPSKDELLGYSTTHSFPITPILGVLIGIVGALVIVAIIIVVIMRLRSSPSNKKNAKDGSSKPLNREDSDSNQPRPRIVNDVELEAATIPQKLKHVNYYETQPNLHPDDENKAFEMTRDADQDAEYAELLFNKSGRKKKKSSKKNGKLPKSPDSTIYASIDHVQTEKQKLIQRQQQKPVPSNQHMKMHPTSPQEVPTPPPTPPPVLMEALQHSPEVLIASPIKTPKNSLAVKDDLKSNPQGLRPPLAKEVSLRKSDPKPLKLDKPPIAKKPEGLKKKKRTIETQTQDIEENKTNRDKKHPL